MGKLMSDFHCREPKEMNYKILSEQANRYKYEEGENTVSQMVEEYARRRAEEAAREAAIEAAREAAKKEAIAIEETEKKKKAEFARSLIEEGSFSHEKIAALTKLSVNEVKKIALEVSC
ncbi:MAG: hypothetical protein HDT46_11275 [Ruminococcaceae bacterium]|nr:hypothetical protein [Oscillospiraceae bacterium]